MILLLALGPLLFGGSPQQPPLVRMGVVPSTIPKTLGLSLQEVALAHGVPWGCLWQKGSFDSPPLLSWGGPPPGNTSSLVKERYQFTSSLSSNMLFTNSHGSPPAGRLFCSTQ